MNSELITKQLPLISKEKSKAYEELHSLVDANEGNLLLTHIQVNEEYPPL